MCCICRFLLLSRVLRFWHDNHGHYGTELEQNCARMIRVFFRIIFSLFAWTSVWDNNKKQKAQKRQKVLSKWKINSNNNKSSDGVWDGGGSAQHQQKHTFWNDEPATRTKFYCAAYLVLFRLLLLFPFILAHIFTLSSHAHNTPNKLYTQSHSRWRLWLDCHTHTHTNMHKYCVRWKIFECHPPLNGKHAFMPSLPSYNSYTIWNLAVF